jgi:Phosphotransferase system, mannose/fructose/N-acetylgalactosamine-specific component IID
MNEAKITKMDIWRAFWRWWWTAEMSNSYERMQAIAYCFALMPVLKKLYQTKEGFSEALQRHLAFYNTEGLSGTIILGVTIAMEEEKSKHGEFPAEAIIGFKTGLMGPIAGIGDSIMHGTIRPLIFTLALTASATGSIAGVFIIFLFPLLTGIISWWLMINGYKLGKSAIVTLLESGWVNRIITGASILGLFMIGALSAKIVSLPLAGSFMNYGVKTTYQSVLDGIIPGLLPLLIVMGIYTFFKKKGQKFTTVICIIIGVSLLLSFLKII